MIASFLLVIGATASAQDWAPSPVAFKFQRGAPTIAVMAKPVFTPGDWLGYLAYIDASAGAQNAGKNSIDFLVDREVMAPALAAVSGARNSIHIEVFQYQADKIGWSLARVLAKKAAGGVRVRVLLDAKGSNTDHQDVKALLGYLRGEGVHVLVRPAPPLDTHLDHRKVMVVDGLIGFTGGMNIGETYQEQWHDQQSLIRGPAVALLQKAFLSQWQAVGGTTEPGENLLPPSADQPDGAQTRVVAHLGADHDQNIRRAYLAAFATSQKLIRIADPYFVDAGVIKALETAARRGVKVQIVLPAKNNIKLMQDASRAFYPDLLSAGAEVYEYQNRMAHEKVAVIDDYWTTFGSSNLDPRSLVHNDELNIVATDARLASTVNAKLFEPDLRQSRRILSHKVTAAERAARAIAGQLFTDDPMVP